VRATLDIRDRVLLGLRAASLLTAASFVAVSDAAAQEREAAAVALVVFAGYSLALYLSLWRVFGPGHRGRFYRAASVLDLGFVVALMLMTGGATSPFYRALYLWSAILALNEGLAGGIVGALVSVVVLLSIHAGHGFAADAWVLAVQTGGLLLHGPLIGVIVDRESRHIRELSQARDALHRSNEDLSRANAALAEANERIVKEHEQILHVEKLSTIGLLAAGVAHEINNPLAGVMGCLGALKGTSLEPERRAEYFAAAQDGLVRIRNAVRQLLDYARDQPPSRERVDLREIVEGVRQLVHAELLSKKLNLVVRVSEAPVLADVDRNRIAQAYLNVVLNALYATPKGGTLTFALERAGSEVGLVVEDNGPGIPKENLSRVFDPFFTTKPQGEGTGLGLSVTLGIASAHGGRLAVESELGKGTRVVVWLPALIEERVAADGEGAE